VGQGNLLLKDSVSLEVVREPKQAPLVEPIYALAALRPFYIYIKHRNIEG